MCNSRYKIICIVIYHFECICLYLMSLVFIINCAYSFCTSQCVADGQSGYVAGDFRSFHIGRGIWQIWCRPCHLTRPCGFWYDVSRFIDGICCCYWYLGDGEHTYFTESNGTGSCHSPWRDDTTLRKSGVETLRHRWVLCPQLSQNATKSCHSIFNLLRSNHQ